MILRTIHRDLLLLAILFCFIGCAHPASNESASSADSANALIGPDAPSPQDQAVETKLEQNIAFARFDSVVLAAALQQWSGVAGLELFVDWPALKTVALNPSTPVTVVLQDVRLSKALQQILDSTPKDSYEKRLGYCIDHGRLIITTNQELNQRRVTRTYDISDLLAAQSASRAKFDPTLRTERIKKYLTGKIDDLSWTENVDVLSWQDAADSSDAIRAGAKDKYVLVVVQLPAVQWKIQTALASLREEASR